MNEILLRNSTITRRCCSYILSFYRIFISPVFGPSCRFSPSCSVYCEHAIHRFGLIRGIYISIIRIFRCNPFFLAGFDPVPEEIPPLFERHK
jgi:uncharacterized protein